jgi:NTP pyrophosphatase (non-canonical NTP hydrolase)
MMDLGMYEELIVQWASDRGIIQNSTPQIQGLKLVSEIGELADNLAKGRDVRDDIGDCIVVLSIIANMKGIDLHKCVEVAYNDIRDRKGHLNSDGIFIKEGDK